MVLSRFIQRALSHAPLLSVALFAGTLLAVGCGKKSVDVKSQADELQKLAPAANQAAPGTADWYINAASTAVRSNDFIAAIALLRSAGRVSGLTPEQMTAVQDMRRAISNELLTRADKGDQKAKETLEAIQQSP